MKNTLRHIVLVILPISAEANLFPVVISVFFLILVFSDFRKCLSCCWDWRREHCYDRLLRKASVHLILPLNVAQIKITKWKTFVFNHQPGGLFCVNITLKQRGAGTFLWYNRRDENNDTILRGTKTQKSWSFLLFPLSFSFWWLFLVRPPVVPRNPLLSRKSAARPFLWDYDSF